MSPAAGGGVDALRGVVRIAKAASIGVTGNGPRIERAEQAIAAVAELIAAAKDYEAHPYDAEGVNIAARSRLLAALSNIEGAST